MGFYRSPNEVNGLNLWLLWVPKFFYIASSLELGWKGGWRFMCIIKAMPQHILKVKQSLDPNWQNVW
jgi:hypothetical protein